MAKRHTKHRVVDLLIAQCNQQAVHHELNVLAHQVSVHANKLNRKSICKCLVRLVSHSTDESLYL